jgi:hypothetical protein
MKTVLPTKSHPLLYLNNKNFDKIINTSSNNQKVLQHRTKSKIATPKKIQKVKKLNKNDQMTSEQSLHVKILFDALPFKNFSFDAEIYENNRYSVV